MGFTPFYPSYLYNSLVSSSFIIKKVGDAHPTKNQLPVFNSTAIFMAKQKLSCTVPTLPAWERILYRFAVQDTERWNDGIFSCLSCFSWTKNYCRKSFTTRTISLLSATVSTLKPSFFTNANIETLPTNTSASKKAMPLSFAVCISVFIKREPMPSR